MTFKSGERTLSLAPTTAVQSNEAFRGRDLLGLPVYTIAEGRLLGTIDGLLVQREDQSVPLIRIKHGTLGRHCYVPFAAMQTVGVDIALVPSEQSVRNALSPDEGHILDLVLRGRSVLTPTGQQVGTLAGFEVDTSSGKIVSLRVKANAGFFRRGVASVRDETICVPHPFVKSLGTDAILLEPAGALLFAEEPPPPPTAAHQTG